MIVVYILSSILIIIGMLMLMVSLLFVNKNNNFPNKKRKCNNICILIPARYESKIIERLLLSIENQTKKINMKDVYVIVESKKDKTVDICKKHNATVFVRKRLDLKTKGYALDECIKDIYKNKRRYDLYFIFDADNVLDKNYIKSMIPIYEKGYDLACGYRNTLNGNASVVAASSSLTFSLINTLYNDFKNKKSMNITFSGTGYYISGDVMDNLKSFPFNSLTEDYEITTYATINNLTTYYNKKSIFYDEQPIRYKDTINQRTRWIREYFDVRKKYSKYKLSLKDNNIASKINLKFGVVPFIFMIFGFIIYLVGSISYLIFNIIKKLSIIRPIMYVVGLIILIYLLLMLITFIMLLKEKSSINIINKMRIKTLLYNPIFMLSFVQCAFKAFSKKQITWTKVEHGN